MLGRERADGIRSAGVAGEQKSLAAAAAEILRAALTASTRFGHPLLSAKALERSRLSPNPFQRTLAHIVKAHAGNDSRRVTRKHLPRRVNQHQAPSPSAHAGLGIARVVIRNHAIN